jgi:hypothetical protein
MAEKWVRLASPKPIDMKSPQRMELESDPEPLKLERQVSKPSAAVQQARVDKIKADQKRSTESKMETKAIPPELKRIPAISATAATAPIDHAAQFQRHVAAQKKEKLVEIAVGVSKIGATTYHIKRMGTEAASQHVQSTFTGFSEKKSVSSPSPCGLESVNAQVIYVTCPHCLGEIQIAKQEINCGIFRHATFKGTGVQVDSHAPQSVIAMLMSGGMVRGCGQPFKVKSFEGKYVAETCGFE